MARYGVYSYPAGEGLLLDVQSDFLDDLKTSVVVPLMASARYQQTSDRLNPSFFIAETEYHMMTQFIASVQQMELGQQITQLAHEHDRIRDALDMLLHGF